MKTCFVVMGFGEKTDYQTGRKLNLDASYRNLIKPAVEAAGLQCIRADEIVHAGIIDVPMYEQLLSADVVVADVSTMNPNAFYELGVRHALRPYTTIIVAENELKFPFDVGHLVIRQYKHLGEDIGMSEARRFQGVLSDAIREILAAAEPKEDSPVYTFLRLEPPSRIQEQKEQVTVANPSPASDPVKNETLRMLLDQAELARKNLNWPVAKFLFEQAKDMQRTRAGLYTVDPYILQQLALATYKADGTEAGLIAAREVLRDLSPETSTDAETLGIWGAIHKRLWDKTGDRSALDEAVTAYARGFYIRNDYYNAINFAFLLNVRASVSKGDDAVADRVVANRIRKQTISICQKLLQEPERKPSERYWAMATIAEACYALRQKPEFDAWMATAIATAPESWMVETTRDQLAKLDNLLG